MYEVNRKLAEEAREKDKAEKAKAGMGKKSSLVHQGTVMREVRIQQEQLLAEAARILATGDSDGILNAFLHNYDMKCVGVVDGLVKADGAARYQKGADIWRRCERAESILKWGRIGEMYDLVSGAKGQNPFKADAEMVHAMVSRTTYDAKEHMCKVHHQRRPGCAVCGCIAWDGQCNRDIARIAREQASQQTVNLDQVRSDPELMQMMDVNRIL
jgi:hypothetical protein